MCALKVGEVSGNFSVSDYSGVFQAAIGTTNAMKESIATCQEDVANCKNKLSDASIFMGPIADSCKEALTTIDSFLTTLSENYNTIANYLDDTSTRYQNGDKEAAKTVLNAGSNGVVSAGNSAVPSSVSNSDYLNPKGITGPHLDFINSIKDGAIAAYEKYGVLPSVTLAQAIDESGWGEEAIGNNIFGIKATDDWTGKVQNSATSEQNPDGSYEQINADFRDYDSIEDSIVDHAEVLSQDRYSDVISAKNYVDACHAVQNGGYATSLTYADTLIDIIEYNGLDQWDPK